MINNPSNAEATVVISENPLNPVMLDSLDSSRWVLPDEYPFARVSVLIDCIFL